MDASSSSGEANELQAIQSIDPPLERKIVRAEIKDSELYRYQETPGLEIDAV